MTKKIGMHEINIEWHQKHSFCSKDISGKIPLKNRSMEKCDYDVNQMVTELAMRSIASMQALIFFCMLIKKIKHKMRSV